MSTTLRTLCTLLPGEKLNGVKCLRGSLARELITTDDEGNQRRYPVGTKLVLRRNARGDYSLLALIDERQQHEAERLYHEARQRHGGER